jgi:hypothetical protein
VIDRQVVHPGNCVAETHPDVRKYELQPKNSIRPVMFAFLSVIACPFGLPESFVEVKTSDVGVQL